MYIIQFSGSFIHYTCSITVLSIMQYTVLLFLTADKLVNKVEYLENNARVYRGEWAVKSAQ